MNTNINTLVETLVTTLQISQIYHWTYARDGKKLPILHIHLQKSSGMRFGEAKELCSSIFEKRQDVCYTLYYKQEIQDLVNQGLGRFSVVCRPENKIYQRDATEGDIIFRTSDIHEIAKRCTSYIDIERNKVSSFIDGYHFFLNTDNRAHAAFMLHQALELTLRTALMLLVGYEKKSHCLVNNITHLKTYDSVLGRLFIKDKDHASLRILNSAYNASRYNQGFQIDKGNLETAYKIMEKAIAWIDTYQIEYTEEIKRELTPEYIAQKRIDLLKTRYREDVKSTAVHNHKELILRAIEIYCKPKLVSCFAYKSQQRQRSSTLLFIDEKAISHHYYVLLAITEEQIKTLELQQNINEILPLEIDVTLIIEKEDIILKKAQKGHPFFCNVLQARETWIDETIKPLLALPIPYESTAYLNKQWCKRLQNARVLLTLCNDLNSVGDERAVCFAIATAIEQVCLGLIKNFLGYSSPILNLNYLMKLVDIIAPGVSVVFCRENKRDNELFKLMVEAQKEFRYSTGYFTSEKEVSILHERVNKFIRLATSCVEEHFEKQKINDDKGAVLIT